EGDIEDRGAVVEERAVAEKEFRRLIAELPAGGRAEIPGGAVRAGPGERASGELEREGLLRVVVDELEAGAGSDPEIRRAAGEGALVAEHGEGFAVEDLPDRPRADGDGAGRGEPVVSVDFDEVGVSVSRADRDAGSGGEG